jgi:hypothetical protein
MRERKMKWILVIVTVSGPVWFPGYKSLEECESAWKQFHNEVNWVPPFHDVWKDGRCLPMPREAN